MYIYIYIYLREFVLNSRHPGPRREKWGWERRPLRHFGRIMGIREIRGWIPRGYFLCAGIAKWTHLLGIGRPIFDQSEQIALGTPRHPQGTPRGPKMPSNATWFRQHVPKCRQMRHGFDNILIKEYGPYGPQGPWAHKTKMFLLSSYYVVIIILIMMIQGQGPRPGPKKGAGPVRALDPHDDDYVVTT